MCGPVDPKDLLEFPCCFTFKAVGISGLNFSQGIAAAVKAHATLQPEAVQIKPSGKGNYQSVSIPVQLDTYQQLTEIYAAMKTVPGLKMLL